MHKNIITGYLLLTFLAMTVLSCRKDEQSFVYEKLNRVSISPDSSFVMTQYDTLKFEPVFTDTKSPGVPYTYQWVIYLQSGEGTATVLSTEPKLKAEIRLSPGSYSMQCRVTDPQTGITAIKLYSVTVNGKFYSGWLVSNNRNGGAHLDFLRADDLVILDPAEIANKTTFPGNAIAAYNSVSGGIAINLFFTDKGAYRFNANDFFQNASTDKLFPEGKTFSTLPAYAINALGTEQLIVSEGGLYAGIAGGFGAEEAQVLTPFSDRLNGDYNLFPGLATSGLTTTYVYDNKYKRFMQTAYGSRTLVPSTTNGTFNMGNVGKTAIGFDRGAVGTFYPTGEYYFIMKDDVNNRYVLSINNDAPALNQLIGNSPDIGMAKYFATASAIKQLYYATDSKLYLYDITASTGELLFTFPAGYSIADIKMQRTGVNRVVVAANKGTAGEVFYFDLDVRGRVLGGTYSKKFEGFGEIVHLGPRSI